MKLRTVRLIAPALAGEPFEVHRLQGEEEFNHAYRYEVEISFVRECYEHGFLGRGVKVERSIAIPAARLDRVAEVVRLHRHMGLDFDAIELWFETAG